MAKIQVITSMNQSIADQYGRVNAQSMINWVECDDFIVYSEESDLSCPGLIRKLNYVEGFAKFREMCRGYPFLCGMVDDKEYNYNYDAYKFCAKGFAIIDVLERQDADIVVWIDADARFGDALRRDQIEKMVDGKMGAFMLRNKKHLCTSFMVFNLQHPESRQILEVISNMYRRAMVFALPFFQDAYMMQAILDSNPWSITNLSEGLDIPAGPHNVFDDVFSGIGKHFKGNLKKQITEHQVQVKNRYQELLAHLAILKPKCILEIGTWNGMRALEMMKTTGAKMYYGIDLFEEATDDTDAAEMNVKPHFAVNKVSEMLFSNQIECRLFKGDSKKVLPHAIQHARENGDIIDFVFVDGGHSIDTVWNDWLNVKNLIDQGAIAAFDDYYEDGPDTKLFGCNDVIGHIKELENRYVINIGECRDPVNGGGTTRLVFVRRNDEVNVNEGDEEQRGHSGVPGEFEGRDQNQPESEPEAI